MPYIKKEERLPYIHAINKLCMALSRVSPDKQDGHVNFIITAMLKSIYPLRYQHLNRAMGVLECVKQ